jgi:hypothetical protein
MRIATQRPTENRQSDDPKPDNLVPPSIAAQGAAEEHDP